MREIVILACQACKRRNYSFTRNKATHKEKLSLRKYCPFCRKHVEHRETK